MLTRKELESYVDRASFSLDETLRFNHEGCATTSSSKSLSITRTSNGYVGHCFKCDQSGFLPDKHAACSQTIVHSNGHGKKSSSLVSSTQRHTDLLPPRNAEHDPGRFAPGAAVWIKRFLTEQEIRDNGIVCCNHTGRLFFPLHPSGWIFRNTSVGAVPKWYTKTPRGFYHSRCTNSTDVCVVVEDIVSCIRCSRYADAYAMCGTVLHDNVLSLIAKGGYAKAIVFLDDDNATVKRHALQAKRKLELVVPEVQVYHSGGTDPKETPDAELRRILCS